jgi:hypothetical protein
MLVNTHMHGLIGGKVESESFSHDFRLPKCYDIPKAKLRDITPSSTASMGIEGEIYSTDGSMLVSSTRCKQFPDKVLFYIFYNMPHDKA